jgi:hypothetical protein
VDGGWMGGNGTGWDGMEMAVGGVETKVIDRADAVDG